jgi:drug/metabolite transporter (DMT)-like permease
VWRALPGEAWFALLFLGVLGTALAHWFWQEGVARIGAARAGTFLYLEPLATTALAVPYLGEPLTMATVAGGSLVLAGVWLSHRRLEPE